MSDYRSTVVYTAPQWAHQLNNIPKKRVILANLPTPLHEWKVPGVPDGYKLSIKRDDLTGSGFCGNKIRKFEFLLADAILQGCKSIITIGAVQSNLCSATAVLARELGLDTHLLLFSDKIESSLVDRPGNLLPPLLCDSKLYFIPFDVKTISTTKEVLSKEIELKTGCRPYYIPIGGSDAVGVFGYIHAWNEMITEHNLIESFDDIVLACGSVGTVAGLAIGNYLTGQKLRIHAFSISEKSDFCIGHINDMLDQLGIKNCAAEELVDAIDDYVGGGYAISTDEDREYCMKVASTTGVLVDPVYTGKALLGMLSELKNNPKRFKGNRILFINTGGIMSMYNGAMQNDISKKFVGENTFAWQNDTRTFKKAF